MQPMKSIRLVFAKRQWKPNAFAEKRLMVSEPHGTKNKTPIDESDIRELINELGKEGTAQYCFDETWLKWLCECGKADEDARRLAKKALNEKNGKINQVRLCQIIQA